MLSSLGSGVVSFTTTLSRLASCTLFVGVGLSVSAMQTIKVVWVEGHAH